MSGRATIRLRLFPSSFDYDVASRRGKASDDPSSFHFRRDKGLRLAPNKRTLRAFRNADGFTTFKIFRRPGALRGLTNSTAVFRSRFGRSN
jgi:hypothetical protein